MSSVEDVCLAALRLTDKTKAPTLMQDLKLRLEALQNGPVAEIVSRRPEGAFGHGGSSLLKVSRFRTSLRFKIGALLLILSIGPFLVVDTVGILLIASRLRQFSERIGNTEMALRTDVVGKNLKGAASDTAVEIDNAVLRMLADLRHWGEEDVVVQAAQAEDKAARTLFRPGATEELSSHPR